MSYSVYHLSLFLLATDNATNNAPAWWEVTTGILAIPASLIGLAYSYVLIKKTKLEARKTELEIREKEDKIRELSAIESETARDFFVPIIESRISQYLVLRFILLYLILRAWGLIQSALGLAITGTAVAILGVSGLQGSSWIAAPFLVLQKLPEVVYWLIFFVIGWPLFKDINSELGLEISDIFRWKK